MTSVSGNRPSLLLAGDVGGTKTDLVVVSAVGGPRQPLAKRRYPSTAYASLAEMARSFVAGAGLEVQAACFDVAGPVINGEAWLTNLGWRLDESSLAAALQVERAWLINDMVAMAGALPLLQPDELHPVKSGEALPGGPIAVLAPGTGLGEAFLTHDDTRYRVHGSEGGHAAFAPTTELELDLLHTLWEQFDHVSVERVASGVGIPNLYAFLRDRRGMAESPALAGALAVTEDRARPILRAALDPAGPDPLARATVTVFLRILGAEAANLTLKVLATGGVYLAGGIAQVLRDELGTPAFLDAFVRAGRFGTMLQRVPVHVALGDVALLGAASEGLRMLALAPTHAAR
ncbi:MAG TPA: glucokinase [Candidatus Dormibacteraeota bacterium]